MIKEIPLKFDLPDWAKYTAVDENGDFCAFEKEPFCLDTVIGEGIFETKDNFILLAKNCVTSNWKESLTQIN